jgi:hypothetical protein
MDGEGSGNLYPRRGMTRRDLIRKGAIVGGLVCTAPVIQSMTTPASAENFSQNCEGCCCCDLPSNPGPGGTQCFQDGISPAACRSMCSSLGGTSRSYCSGQAVRNDGQSCFCTGHACFE